jgi:D-alanyl-D-alanine carboxypeptidase
MSMANGQLPGNMLISVGQGLFLQREAAESFNAMRAQVRRRTGYTIMLNAGYRTLAKQQALYDGWLDRRPGFNLAAFPGTSNHGWGLAIDLQDWPSARPPLDRFGAPFGWSKTWSDAPSEGWHIRCDLPTWRRNRDHLLDPFAALLDAERRWLREYLELKRTNSDPKRRRRLWHQLRTRRRDIWRQANKSGWDPFHRRERYAIIRHYIGG